MKIRTITTGISLHFDNIEEKIQQAAEFNQHAQQIFENHHYEVQTTRIATNSWTEYLSNLSPTETLNHIQKIEQQCQKLKVHFFNIGNAGTAETIALLPDIIQQTSVIYASSTVGNQATGILLNNIQASAKAIKRIADETDAGFGNFRFCAAANCPAGIPFFPAAYHLGEPAFSLGLEIAELALQAFTNAESLLEAQTNLQSILATELTKIEAIARQISNTFPIKYHGIDSSLAPSLNQESSIAYLYEKLGLQKFGNAGTLAISAMITQVLKNLPVQLCGYSGLMLPVCEDIGLAQRANEQMYNLTDLLLYSAVCGCGLDTVPLAGDISLHTLEAILLDMTALALQLNKPLSARLFPIPDKKQGEMTAFNSPYLVDCKVFNVS